MKAYELAYWMENAVISDDWGELAKYYKWCNEHIPSMLRKQADRIVELQNDYAELNMKFNAVSQSQADRITELEKELKRTKFAWNMAENEIERLTPQTNAEPVAWWFGKKDDESEDFIYPETRQKFIDHPIAKNHLLFPIPLYTTPQTKPLSDEEITKIYEKVYESSVDNQVVALARAIEERILGK